MFIKLWSEMKQFFRECMAPVIACAAKLREHLPNETSNKILIKISMLNVLEKASGLENVVKT